MIGKRAPRQEVLFLPGSLRSFLPDDHVLVQVDGVLELSWLEAEVREVYCEANGRRSVPPESAVRLMLAGFLLGIVHDRALLREAQVNLAIRWFAGYGLDQALPDHSTLTRIRQRWGAERFRRILERTVQQCVAAGLVDVSTLHVDATLVRADVSWSSLVASHAEQVLAANTEPEAVGVARSRTGKPKKRSTTDPDATLATAQKDQRLEPTFKQHTAVEDQSGVVTDVAVTTGEAPEGEQLLGQIERVESTTGQPVRTVTADRAYSSGQQYAALEQRQTDAVIALPAERRSGGRYGLARFRYDAQHRLVRCPGGKWLRPQRTDRRGTWYQADRQDCAACPRRDRCLSPQARRRQVLIVHGYPALLRARRRRRRRDPVFREAYRRHHWRVEGVHGQLKTQYGLRRAVRRGLANMAIQAYLAAVALNLKILARALRSLCPPPDTLAALVGALQHCWADLLALWPPLPAPSRRFARATTS